MNLAANPPLSEETISALYAQQCAAEPIQRLGKVQPHGFLMVVDLATHHIVQVSAGIVRHWQGLGEARRVIGTPLADWINPLNLPCADWLQALPEDGIADIDVGLRDLTQPHESMTSVFVTLAGYECVAHRRGAHAVLEWMPHGHGKVLDHEETQQLLRLNRALARMRHANRLDDFFHDAVVEMQALCGYDRVMLYRFLPDHSGEVVAEHVGRGLEVQYLGLRFPATDIPPQARALYEINTLRVLADVDAVPDPLLPATLPDGSPLDQSHCLLRGMSPAHLSYLRNMGVRSTMVISLLKDGRLWGLLSCHHYHQQRVPPHHVRELMRSACELISNVVIMRIDDLMKIEHAEKTSAFSQLIEQLSQSISRQGSLVQGCLSHAPELCSAFGGVDFGFRLGSHDWVSTPRHDEARQQVILDEIESRARTMPAGSVQMFDDLQVPGGQPLASLPAAAGLLLARGNEHTDGFCYFTRPALVEVVKWAGEPGKFTSVTEEGQIRLQPRASFALWQEMTTGRAKPWGSADIEAMRRLANLLAEMHKTLLNQDLQRELDWRAHHDHLTGLLNRSVAEEELARRVARPDRFVALFMIDLDHFKRINDTLGHAVGDLVLKEISRRLTAVTRDDDLLARLGGDEFLLLTNLAQDDKSQVAAIAQRLHDAMRQPFFLDGQSMALRLSVGAAYSHEHGSDASTLMRHADLALYVAKDQGRGRSAVYVPDMEHEMKEGMLLEDQLRTAISHQQLRLHYQPKVDLRTRRVVGLEALVRWQHPERGLMAPDSFIGMAERNNLINPLGRWVLDEAVRQMAQWQHDGVPAWPVAVNVSFAQIVGGTLAEDVTRSLRQHGVAAHMLELELTESVVMENTEQTIQTLRSLAQTGLKVSLDDFGTGYSSLAYVRQLPLDSLKIDRSFVNNLQTNLQSQVLANGIIGLARGLKLHTIAEGVETEEQEQWLRDSGCDAAQGYHFSRPVPAAELPAAVARIEAHGTR